ncbi:caspase family protein [Candidatus Palauibacter sp.]|uniref:caspase family protein n=1 Tax=Candidatus Palauibacter sp. TaxID=3101350 RepID=UPI003B51FFA1
MKDISSTLLTAERGFTAGHAVVIGVARYKNAYPLPDAVTNDARDVAEILTSDAYCGYRANNVHLLLDGDATLARIRTALDSVAKASGPNDSVVIFFSGHGTRLGDPADPQSALLPVEFDMRAPDTTSLSETEFSLALRRISAERLLVLIDACNSGGAGRLKDSERTESLVVGYSEKSLIRLAEGTGRVLFASCRADEVSHVFDSARNSVFTSKLLEALRGEGRTSGDGVIRVFEIFNHVAEMVKRALPGRQHPIFKASGLEDNFPVALDRGGIKAISTDATSSAVLGIWEQLERLMPDLYPSGPMDQEVWARAGGDPSRLHLSDTGRAVWFKALRTLRRGGGGASISRESLVRTALQDYPHHPALAALV